MARTMVGFVSPGHVATDFAVSLLNLQQHSDITRFASVVSGPGIARGRNDMMESWLTGDEPEDFFLMVDTDMVFTQEDYVGLRDALIEHPKAGAAAAIVVSYRIGYGLYIAAGEWSDAREGRYNRFKGAPSEPMEDICAGAGMVLLRREALLDISPPLPWPKGQPDKPWEYMPPNRSEDVAFAIRLRAGGWPMMVVPSVNPGHIKQYKFTLADGIPTTD